MTPFFACATEIKMAIHSGRMRSLWMAILYILLNNNSQKFLIQSSEDVNSMR